MIIQLEYVLIIIKKKYDQDTCSYHSECSSLECSEGKCAGLSQDALCRPGVFQCKNNLVCRKSIEILPYKELKEVYKCGQISKKNEQCENDNECDMRLVCLNNNITNLINNTEANNITELKNNINFDEYISLKNESNKICIDRASLENGLPTNDPMACKSGDSINVELFSNYTETFCASKKQIIKDCNEDNICIIKANLGKFGDIEIEQQCYFDVRGNPLCPLDQKEVAWKNYLSVFEDYISRTNSGSNYHIPAHKYTLNILEISQTYWHYSEWIYFIEADSCTQEYFFLKNSDKNLHFSILYILINFFLLYNY